MNDDLPSEWLRLQMLASLGSCEICGAVATSVVRDLVESPEADAPGKVVQGELHHFCTDHHRDPLTSAPPQPEAK